MPPEEQEPQREEIEKAARDRAEGSSRVRETAERLAQNPKLLAYAWRMRERLPGDERFGDPLSTAGQAPVELVARGISSLSPERESVFQELGTDRQAARRGWPRRPGHQEVTVSEPALECIDLDGLEVGRRRRLRADGAPSELHIVTVARR